MTADDAIATTRARWRGLAERPVDPADVEERVALRLEDRDEIETRCMADHGAVRLYVRRAGAERWRSAYVRAWRETDAVLDRLLGGA